MKRLVVYLLLFGSLGIAASGQIVDGDDEILEIDTHLVDVPVEVTDPEGKPFRNLSIANFSLLEDGVPQEIAEFGAASAPFEVALLLDTSGSTRSDLRLIRRAAEIFIDSLRPGDRVSIISFNSRTKGRSVLAYSEVVIDLTDERSELFRALEKISTSNGTPYYDSLLQAVEIAFRHKPEGEYRGRRAIVALTDGVDSTSDFDFRDVREAFAGSEVVSYFISINTREEFEDSILGDCETSTQLSRDQIKRYYALFPDNGRMEKVYDFCKIGDFSKLDMARRLYQLADEEMKDLASLTGGKVFPVADIREAADAFEKVAREIGTRYTIRYYSSNESHDGKFRKISVTLKGLPKGSSVRAREGYTAPVEVK